MERTWIPCSKKLPEKHDSVWLTIQGHDIVHLKDGETLDEALDRLKGHRWVTNGYLGSDGWYGPDGWPMTITPIAWMPIDKPEPWEGKC